VTTRGGLLIAGVVVSVDGLAIDNPITAPSWCKLDGRDYRRRRSSWIRQIIVHTTKGLHPQHVIPGAGAGGRARHVAEFWRRDETHSAAHLVVDTDGAVACLADVAEINAYHATVSNDWSVGIELYQEADGGIYAATLASAVALVRALCEQLSIPLQIPTAYRGRPIERMADGGPTCAGVFGHRDNTTRRGRGDPGDAIMLELELAGAERLDFDRGVDLARWADRQRKLNAMGETLTVDGLAGPGTMRALRRHGFTSGRELDAAVEAQ
jgi:hypothetical protein